MKFEWNPKKAASNVSKHGVTFEAALAVFSDPLARIFDDEDHSIQEHREIIIGHSVSHRLLLRGTTGVDSDLQRTDGNEARAEGL